MLKKMHLVFTLLAVAVASAAAADTTAAAPTAKLSAAEIVAKNAEARGGLQAWRAVQTISMSGTMQAGGSNRPKFSVPGMKTDDIPGLGLKEQAELPFVMEMKRPHKSRVEIKFAGQTAVQVYDGTNGWKLRPFLNRHEVEPFTADELKGAALQSDLDGYLIDAAAKGTKVEVEGIEKVEKRDAYKLKLTLKNGQMQRVWVDAQTFLEVKMQGWPRRLDGKYHPVAVYLRDYRTVGGLKVPFLLETAVDGVKQTEKIQIETVTVGPKLEDSLFAKLQ